MTYQIPPNGPSTYSGLDYLAVASELLQKCRHQHPTFGVYEAAEVQFWWARPRGTDTFEQLFWRDQAERLSAGAVITDFGNGTSLVYAAPVLSLLTTPETPAGHLPVMVDAALAHAAANGIESVEIEVRQTDAALNALLSERGFVALGEAVAKCWLDTSTPPAVTDLAVGYRLAARSEISPDQKHHLANADETDVEARLQQTSLYRADLDLVVLDEDDKPAAYGLFWFDPVTATGVVEPMRTHDDHQRKGLARHILTSGINRLATLGAQRIAIAYEPDNPASGTLYLSVGFVEDNRTNLLQGPTSQG